MQLTKFTQYAIYTLSFLAVRPNQRIKVQDISEHMECSYHSLVKIIQFLVHHHYINSHTGKRGGLQLSKHPSEIYLGELILRSEPVPHLDEIDRENEFIRSDKFKIILDQGNQTYIESINQYSLMDLLPAEFKVLHISAS